MGYPSPAIVKRLKSLYPPRITVVLDSMDDVHAPPVGSKGEVICVDDIGTVHVKWENGSCLGLIHGQDKFHIERN